MPGLNGKGPENRGPGTGFGRGLCMSANETSEKNASDNRFSRQGSRGAGFGRKGFAGAAGRGTGRGMGQGKGRGMGRGTGCRRAW